MDRNQVRRWHKMLVQWLMLKKSQEPNTDLKHNCQWKPVYNAFDQFLSYKNHFLGPLKNQFDGFQCYMRSSFYPLILPTPSSWWNCDWLIYIYISKYFIYIIYQYDIYIYMQYSIRNMNMYGASYATGLLEGYNFCCCSRIAEVGLCQEARHAS